MNNNKLNFKPKVRDNQHNSKAYHDKSKTSNDKDRLAAIPTREDATCFNCKEPGHYARDCKKPKWNKLHVRAAHTAIINEENNDDQDNQLSEHSDQPSTGSQGYQSDEEEMVKVDVYNNNDWYDRVSDTEHMFAIGEIDQTPVMKSHEIGLAPDTDKVRFWKVHLCVDKTARVRPDYKPEEIECLATLVSIGGCEAWTLWDSGSTTMGLTPMFAQVADL